MTRDDYDRGEVIRIMLPYLMQLAAAGCRTLTECTPEFLGRDPYLLAELSELSGLHIITNTGYYQKPLCSLRLQTSSRIWLAYG